MDGVNSGERYRSDSAMNATELRACDFVRRYLRSTKRCMVIDGKKQPGIKKWMGESAMNGLGGMDGEVYDHAVTSLFFIPVEVVRQIMRSCAERDEPEETGRTGRNLDEITGYSKYVEIVSEYGVVMIDVSDRDLLFFVGTDWLHELMKVCISCSSYPSVIARMLDNETKAKTHVTGVLSYYYRWFYLSEWFRNHYDGLTFGKTIGSDPIYAVNTKVVSETRHYFGVMCTYFHATMLLYTIVHTVVDHVPQQLRQYYGRMRWEGDRSMNSVIEENVKNAPSPYELFVWTKEILETSVEIGGFETRGPVETWKQMDRRIFGLNRDKLVRRGMVMGRICFNDDRNLVPIRLPDIPTGAQTLWTELVYNCAELFRILINGVFLLRLGGRSREYEPDKAVLSNEVTNRLMDVERRRRDSSSIPEFRLTLSNGLCQLLQNSTQAIFVLQCGGLDLSLRGLFDSYYGSRSERRSYFNPQEPNSGVNHEVGVLASVGDKMERVCMNRSIGFTVRFLRTSKRYPMKEGRFRETTTDYTVRLFCCTNTDEGREEFRKVGNEGQNRTLLFRFNLEYNSASPLDVANTIAFFSNRFPFFSGDDYDLEYDCKANEILARGEPGVRGRILSYVPVWMHYMQIEPRNCIMASFLYRNYIRSVERNDCVGMLTVAESLYVLCGGMPMQLLFSAAYRKLLNPDPCTNGKRGDCIPSTASLGDVYVLHMSSLPRIMAMVGAVGHIDIPYKSPGVYGLEGECSRMGIGMERVIPTIFSAVRSYLAIEKPVVIPRQILEELEIRLRHEISDPDNDLSMEFFREYLVLILHDDECRVTLDLVGCEHWVYIPAFYDPFIFFRHLEKIRKASRFEYGKYRGEHGLTLEASDTSPLGNGRYKKFRFVPIRVLYYRIMAGLYKTGAIERTWYILTFFRPMLWEEVSECMVRGMASGSSRGNGKRKTHARGDDEGSCLLPPEIPFCHCELDHDIVWESLYYSDLRKEDNGSEMLYSDCRQIPSYKDPAFYDFVMTVEFLCHHRKSKVCKGIGRKDSIVEERMRDLYYSLPDYNFVCESSSREDDIKWSNALEKVMRECSGYTTMNEVDVCYDSERLEKVADHEKYDLFPMIVHKSLSDDMLNTHNFEGPLFGEGNDLSFSQVFCPLMFCPFAGLIME